jgi:hypothetical protein
MEIEPPVVQEIDYIGCLPPSETLDCNQVRLVQFALPTPLEK